MTSNLATEIIMQETDGKQPTVQDLAAAIRPTLSRHFKPAPPERMTIVPLYPIGAELLKEIVSLKRGQLDGRLRESARTTSWRSAAIRR